ncbi:MAG: DUF4282 domain-containing protein [Chitinophagaceae bacterium]
MEQTIRPTTQSTGFNWSDFFSFRKMIALQIMQILYVIVAVLITIAGLMMLFKGGGSSRGYRDYGDGPFAGGTLMGLLILIFGNVFWRLWCEFMIVLFRINKTLTNIDENTKR